MPLAIASLALGAQLFTAVADRVPEFDVNPTCRSPARREASLSKESDACIADERKARDDIAGRWDTFAAADRVRCTGLVRVGGPPSYIELLTCLEMARDAQNLRRTKPDENTGAR
jgi:hypothetical protein